MSKNTQLGNLVNGIYVDSTGNVGVGTSAPSAKLHTVGTLRINNPSVSGQYMELYTSSGISYYNSQNNSAFYTAFQHIFNTDGATPTERMRITSAGNVGIGTSSPTYKFEVANAGQNFIRFSNTASSADVGIYLTNTAVNGYFGINASEAYIYTATSHPILFYTATAERMRVGVNGNVLIGSSTDRGGYTFQVSGIIGAFGNAGSLLFQNRNGSNTYEWYAVNSTIYVYSNSSASNILQINGSNGAYSALSDVNKKKNFEQSNIGLNEIMQLKPTLYHLKTDDDSSPKELGFIAQEVKELIPQAYSESEDGNGTFIGLNQMPIIAALTKAIQELKAEIDILKNK